MSNFCIVILAAGEGKRMKSSLPKVLHMVGPKPMVNHVVDAARALRPKNIVVVVSRKQPDVKKVLAKDVKAVYQKKPLGTADAVKAAVKEIPPSVKDVIVLYGDTPLVTEATIRALYDFHAEKNASCSVLSTFINNPFGYGRILRNETGQLIGIVEEKDATQTQRSIHEVNTGMYCFNKEDLIEGLAHVQPLNQSGEFYLTDVLSWFFNKNKKIEATVISDSCEVIGVNSQRELAAATQILRQRILERFVESGVVVVDPFTTFIDESVTIGPGTKIFPFTLIEKDVVIGRSCSIGPFCHLRQGSVLEDGVSIGNFTEIKNSFLGEETLVRHMSYIGDTTLGKRVNVGAGMVVANFDGKKKNKTVIKDGAFVGCDAVLIAPVVIGKNAVVGAGSVVPRAHNVPDGATVVGVPAREIKRQKR
jgi:bifunctional UDP-N-acetylglucosamine pyrophosphorylase/glucosamine-1-phosphate N-acetyltransferase